MECPYCQGECYARDITFGYEWACPNCDWTESAGFPADDEESDQSSQSAGVEDGDVST